MPRSLFDVVMGRVGGFTTREIARRTVPCYKHVVAGDEDKLELCLLVDTTRLYRFPHEGLRGIKSLGAKAPYLRGDMEHLRLREFQPGLCRFVTPKEDAAAG